MTFETIFKNQVCKFSDACYHVDENLVTASQAEVECGLRGGRLASFALAAEVNDIKKTLPANEVWLGKNSK